MSTNINAAIFLMLLISNVALTLIVPTSVFEPGIFVFTVVAYVVGLFSNLHPLAQGDGEAAKGSAVIFGSCLFVLLLFRNEGDIPFIISAALCVVGLILNSRFRS